MRIALPALQVHPKRFGGIETYARRIVEALSEVDRVNEYTVFVAEGSQLQIDAPNFTIQRVRAPVGNPYTRVLWEHLVLGRILGKGNFDLTHFLGSTASYRYQPRSIVTIHETLRFQVPEQTPWLYGKYFGAIQRDIVRTGKHVIAVSGTDAAVMQDHLGVSTDRMHVVRYGVSEEFAPPSSRSVTDRRRVLWLGHNYEHKNLKTLLAAFRQLVDRLRERVVLTLVGLTEQEQAVLRGQALKSMELLNCVELRGPASVSEVADLMRETDALCFPSAYESFGLPPLEAMASGVPVVCSDLPCFIELYGDAAVYCQVYAIEEYANALEDLLTNEDSWRLRSEAGLEVASRYTWEECANQTLAVYHKVADA